MGMVVCGLWFGVWGLGFAAWGSGLGILGLVLGVWRLGLGVGGLGVGGWDLGLGVGGLGFGVWGLDCESWGHHLFGMRNTIPKHDSGSVGVCVSVWRRHYTALQTGHHATLSEKSHSPGATHHHRWSQTMECMECGKSMDSSDDLVRCKKARTPPTVPVLDWSLVEPLPGQQLKSREHALIPNLQTEGVLRRRNRDG